jgi:Uma2 family endonuclease
MAMPHPRIEWTLEMVHALPDDGNRYELIDGELLVSAAPSWLHQRVLAELFALMHPYAKSLGGYEVLFAPGAVQFNERRELQPDLTAWRFGPGPDGARVVGDERTLLLTVEALSPSTARNDRYKKRPVFQQHGVTEYWIVDPDARLVERWRPGDVEPEVIIEDLRWQPVLDRALLNIDLPALFRRAHLEE